MVQLGSQSSGNAHLRAATELAEQSEQGFYSALQTSGSHTMMQAGGFAEEVGAQVAGAAALATSSGERRASANLAEQSEQGFYSALQTSGSHTMMQAGGF